MGIYLEGLGGNHTEIDLEMISEDYLDQREPLLM